MPSHHTTQQGVVVCSCGAKTTLKFNRKSETWVAADPHWKFNGEGKPPVQWYCGQEGHTQDRFVPNGQTDDTETPEHPEPTETTGVVHHFEG
jgi:hypothetical protein